MYLLGVIDKALNGAFPCTITHAGPSAKLLSIGASLADSAPSWQTYWQCTYQDLQRFSTPLFSMNLMQVSTYKRFSSELRHTHPIEGTIGKLKVVMRRSQGCTELRTAPCQHPANYLPYSIKIRPFIWNMSMWTHLVNVASCEPPFAFSSAM